MSDNLDKLLADAAGLDDDDAATTAAHHGEDAGSGMAVPSPSAAADNHRGGRRPLVMLATLLAMAAGIVALFFYGFEGAAVYSIPLNKLLGERDQMLARRVRIEGELVPGSLRKRDSPCEYRFEVRDSDKQHQLQVRYPQCVVTGSLRDVPEGGVMITAEGALTKDGHFEATNIMAKCSSKYDAEKHELKPDEGPTAARE